MRAGLALALVATWVGPAIAQDARWPAIRSDYREGRFDSALSRLRSLLADEPDHREALYYMAIIQWRLEDFPAAGAAYRRVLALDPNGPFGQDARMWLEAYGHLAQASPAPSPVPSQAPSVATSAFPSIAPITRVTTPNPSAPPTRSLLPLDALRPSNKPWLQAQPKSANRRARSANPRPGYFKVADGSFEFIPPSGFVLLDESTRGHELTTLFGLPKSARTSKMAPTLLITWREIDELKDLKPDQRAARERQLLMMEASMYGPGARLEGRFGGPCYRVRQSQGDWAADTLLFIQHGKLYALTYGGAASELERYRAQVEKSWTTPLFYP